MSPTDMKASRRREDESGVVLVLMVFLIALSALFVGTLLRGVSTDLQIARNHLYATKAQLVAEAGIEHAISELRLDFTWEEGFDDEEFPAGSDGSYSVEIANSHPSVVITSIGAYSGYVRSIEATVQIVETTAPYVLRVIDWREL